MHGRVCSCDKGHIAELEGACVCASVVLWVWILWG